MTIKYPTLKCVETYLSKYFEQPISLNACIFYLGNNVGKGVEGLLKKANVLNEDITGIDIPVFIPAVNSVGTIMIIEQDPLRKRDDFLPKYDDTTLKQNAIVGTPNALHSAKPVNFYLKLVEKLTEFGWNVYLTDKFKIYAPGLIKQKNRWDLPEKELLKEEIICICPQKVLLFGKEAQLAYADVSAELNLIKQPHPIKLPHPSGNANQKWKEILNGSATDDNKIKFVLNAIK